MKITLKKNKYWDKRSQEWKVDKCVRIIAHKNEEILIGQVKTKSQKDICSKY